jgi:hypothetical protein
MKLLRLDQGRVQGLKVGTEQEDHLAKTAGFVFESQSLLHCGYQCKFSYLILRLAAPFNIPSREQIVPRRERGLPESAICCVSVFLHGGRCRACAGVYTQLKEDAGSAA